MQRPCRCTSTAHVLTVPYRQPGPRVGIFCEYLPLQMASYQPAIIPSTLFFTHPSLASRLISKSGWEAASPIAALKRTAVQSTPPYGNVHLQVGYSSNLIGIGQCRSYDRECVRRCRRLLHHLHTSELSLGRHVGINPKNERSLKCSTGDRWITQLVPIRPSMRDLLFASVPAIGSDVNLRLACTTMHTVSRGIMEIMDQEEYLRSCICSG